MTIKTLFAALALTLLPAVSYAICADSHQAQSCAPGTVWDANQQTCVEQISS